MEAKAIFDSFLSIQRHKVNVKICQSGGGATCPRCSPFRCQCSTGNIGEKAVHVVPGRERHDPGCCVTIADAYVKSMANMTFFKLCSSGRNWSSWILKILEMLA